MPPAGMMIRCPICGGADFSPVDRMSSGGWTADGAVLRRQDRWVDLVACRVCGHVRTGEDYDAPFLESLYNSDPFVSTADMANADHGTLAFCRPELDEARERIVDVGCGGGRLLSLLNQELAIPNDRLVGIDFAPKVRFSCTFIEADLNDLGGLDAGGVSGPFGFAFCTHVLEHVLDPRALLRAIHSWLVPGGYLLLEVPDFSVADIANLHHLALVVPQHIHYFTPGSLTRLVLSCGFDLVRADENPATRLLLRRAHDPTAAEIVATHLATFAGHRVRIAASVLDRSDADGAVGLWGIGAEFTRMREEVPAFDRAMREGRLSLFDLTHAGLDLDGQRLRHPDEIASFAGTVFIMPSNYIVREKMRRHAASRGWPMDRIVDPWA